MEALEVKEKLEEIKEGHEGPASTNLRIGLMIAALAALLALLEAGGKSAQTEAINANLNASDLWAFFQSKTARTARSLAWLGYGRTGVIRRQESGSAPSPSSRCRPMNLSGKSTTEC